MKKVALISILLMSSMSVFAAWDGIITGKIKVIDVVPTNGENFGLRVALEDNPALCGNSNTWAYINKSDDNYEVAASVLLAAKMAEKEVILYSNIGTAGYCHIGYITLK